jgi:hypothetical protein
MENEKYIVIKVHKRLTKKKSNCIHYFLVGYEKKKKKNKKKNN